MTNNINDTYPSFAEMYPDLFNDVKWRIMGDILYWQNPDDSALEMILSDIPPQYHHHIHPDHKKFLPKIETASQ